MAVTFQAVGAIVVSSTLASIDVVAPACAVDDILIVQLLGKDNIDHTGNAGFTELGTQLNNGTSETSSLWWRRAQVGDSGATFAFTKATDNNIFFAGVMTVWRGAVRSGNPFSNIGTPTRQGNASSDTVSYPTFDPAIPCHIIAMGFYSNDLIAGPGAMGGTNPTFTLRVDVETSTGTDCAFFAYDGESDGAATGARSHSTTSSADATNTGWMFGIQNAIDVALAGAQPAPSGTETEKYLIALSGAQPAATGTEAPEKYLIALAGAQPAATGAISASSGPPEVGLAGNQPAASGALTKTYRIALGGSQPAAAGTIAALFLVPLAGAQPAATGALSLSAQIHLAGNQPSATGTEAERYLIALAGVQPSATGSIAAQSIVITLAGAQPAPAGSLHLVASIRLQRNQPNATGAEAERYLIALAGAQPAATGAISASEGATEIDLAGSQPAATGALAVMYRITVTGSQPSATGTHSLGAAIRLTGNQPAATGVLATRSFVVLSGNQPSPSGSLALAVPVSLAGAQPSATGALLSPTVTAHSTVTVDAGQWRPGLGTPPFAVTWATWQPWPPAGFWD